MNFEASRFFCPYCGRDQYLGLRLIHYSFLALVGIVISLALLLIIFRENTETSDLNGPGSTIENPTVTARTNQTEQNSNEAFNAEFVSPTPIVTSIPEPTLPLLRCAIGSYPSHFPAVQISQQGIDILNGFKLELIPLDLRDDGNDVSDEAIPSLFSSGDLDCVFTTLDRLALDGNFGVVTAIIGESVGFHQVWTNPEVKTINDFAGKSIVYGDGLSTEFFLFTLLSTVGLSQNEVNLISAADSDEALRIFNQGDAEVIVGHFTDFRDDETTVNLLIDSSQLRFIIDVIVMNTDTVEQEPELVQSFHRAWFQALAVQAENPSSSARTIANWGNNGWTRVSTESSEDDLFSLLDDTSQANYFQNVLIMKNLPALTDRLPHAQSIWRLSGRLLPLLDFERVVDTQFIRSLEQDITIQSSSRLFNPMGDFFEPLSLVDVEETVPIATLPCERFEFLPNSTKLTPSSQECLDENVIPILRVSNAYLRIIGSAAWPGPVGVYSQEDIENLAEQRALAIANYLAGNGINPNRLMVEIVLPPPERRQISDADQLKKDRVATLTLLALIDK